MNGGFPSQEENKRIQLPFGTWLQSVRVQVQVWLSVAAILT